MQQFSLFEGDPLNRLLARVGLRSRGFFHLAARFLLLLLLTAVPTAIFALLDGYGPGQPRSMNFFGDIAAWGQALIGYPLFIYAELVIEKKTRSASKHFFSSGVVQEADREALAALHTRMHALRQRRAPDLVCFALGFLFALLWLYDETHNAYDTWHAIGAPATQSPTRAGWWVALVGIPIFNYWWLRWIWKIQLWCWYLYKVSRFQLRLIAAHPDMTGGISFLSEAQTSYAIVIFAFGIGIIAPLVGYKLEIEQASLLSYAVAGPLVGFILGAPAFFTVPLLMFTKQLARTKKRAIDAYQDRATSAALYFERSWLGGCGDTDADCERLLGSHLQGMKNLNLVFEHMRQMRVVPFDTKSFSQLIGSTIGSLLPLVTKFMELPEPWTKALEFLKPLLGGH